MSIGEDFAASLASADVRKARAARVQFLGGLNLAQLEREEEKEQAQGTYDDPTKGLYRALKEQRARQEVDTLRALEQPDAILTQYARGIRDGLYSEKFQPVVQQLWTEQYRKLASRSALEKGGALAGAFVSGVAEAIPVISRGVGAAAAVGSELTPAAVATGAAAAELGGAQSMRLLRGIPRLADEDTTEEGLQKIFARDLKELSDIEGVRRYEGKFLRDMTSRAPGLAQAADTIRATLTPEDLETVDDLSNIFDPTEMLPIGFVVTKVGKAFGLSARAGAKSHVMARTFKTAEEAATEAAKLNSTFNKVRKAVGTAMQRTGERVATSTAGAPVTTFVGGLAAGLPPETAFVAAAVSSYLPRGVRTAAGQGLAAAGRTLAKDLPVPLERSRQGLVRAARQGLEDGVEGLMGNAIFALGASTPEEAGGLLGVGAGLGAGTGITAEGTGKALGLLDLTANRFNPAERPVETTRRQASRYNDGLDDIHDEAVAKLDNASANAIEDMRNTLVGPEGRLYIVDTPEQAAKIASFYTGEVVKPTSVESNGFAFTPEQTKQGVGVAVVFFKGEAFAHEPGHLIFRSMEVSSDPKIRALAAEAKQVANRVLPRGSNRFAQVRDYYNSLLPGDAKPIDGDRVIEEFIVEHFTTAVGGAPLIKFGGDMPLSKKIYDIALTLAEKAGAYQSGLDLSGRSPVSSRSLPIRPSPQLAKVVENMLAARQLDLSKDVPATLVGAPVPPLPVAGVQNVEAVIPPPQPPGFKKGDPIGNITNPQGQLVFTGAKVWADVQGDSVRIEGVDQQGNLVRADVPRAWLESQRATATPPIDVGAQVPVPAELTGRPATTPQAQPPTPTVANVTEQQRLTLAGVATPELQAQNEQALVENFRKPVEFEYLSAEPSAESGDAAVRLRERQLADRNEQEGVPNPFRGIFGKVTIPTSIVTTKNGKRNIFAFSSDKLNRNIEQLRGWYLERGDKAAADKLYSPGFQAQVRAYLENQSNGYRGDGERIVRPANTDPVLFPPENPSYTPTKLDENTRNFINFLMGLDPVSSLAMREAWNVFKLAELNGFRPATVVPTSIAGRTKTYFNPFVQQMRDAGFDGKLNSVIEQLRMERIVSPVKPRPDMASIRPAVQGSVQAGFMPAAPEGKRELVNVGLKVGDKISLTKEDVIRAFRDEGLTLEDVEVRASETEPTVIAAVRNADRAKLDRISEKLGQDAIAVFDPAAQTGFLAGPRPENFGGKFLKEYFLMPEEGPAMMPASQKALKWTGQNRNDIYTTLIDATDAGPFDGGCVTFAMALQQKYGGEIVALTRAGGQADHAALKLADGTYLDGDGIAATEADLIKRFNKEERAEAVGIRKLRPGDLKEAPRDKVAADAIAALLPDVPPTKAATAKATKPLKGSLGKGDIKFFHYSDTPNKGKIDPKYFGRSGLTGAREQAGLPRAFAYAEGSTLGQDAGLVDARQHYYEGTAPRGKIYDGVEDVLGYAEEPNRAKADQKLIDKGFIGIYREGVDGRKQLEFFQPMSVVESEKPETPPALAEEAMPILEPLALEEIDYAAQDREFARKKAAEEPLYMPKATEAQEQAFKDSKVRNEDGSLKPMFHFTTADFSRFGKGDLGYHFGTPEQAQARAGGLGAVLVLWGDDKVTAREGARTLPVFLDLKNPLRMKDVGSWDSPVDVLFAIPTRLQAEMPYAVHKAVKVFEEWKGNAPTSISRAEEKRQRGGQVAKALGAIRDGLKAIGYDGIVYRNEYESKEQGEDSYIAFDNDQIMPAFTKDTGARWMPEGPTAPEAPLAGETLSAPRGVLNPPKNTALSLLYGDNPELKAPEGGQTNTGVAKQLMAAAIEENGRKITSKDITPDEEERLSHTVADEAQEALKQTGHAGDWYTKAIKRMLKVARTIFPELADDAAAKSAGFPDAKRAELGLMVALAVTSQNLSVPDNARYAVEQFNILKETGRFDPSRTYGAKGEAISSNLELANTFVDKFGWEGLEAFIGKNFTVGDLSKVISDILGEEVTIAGRVDDVVQGAAIFGPKIGQGFLQNLLGNLFPVTVDLWLRRTWGRLTGDVMPEAVTSRQLAAMLDAYREQGIPLPQELKSLRVVTRQTKSGKSIRRDLTPESYQRILETPAMLSAVDKLAEDKFSDWNRTYKELRLGMDPQWVTDYREGRVTLEDLNRRQQAVLRARERAWDRHVEQAKRTGAKKGSKNDFLVALDEREGRTAKLSNKDLSSGKPDWAKTTAVVFNARKPIDVPTDQDRAVITRVINRARAILAEQGIETTNADIQATIWYPEKDIWAKLRGEDESDLKNSYDEEFLKIADARGLGEAARAALGELGND